MTSRQKRLRQWVIDYANKYGRSPDPYWEQPNGTITTYFHNSHSAHRFSMDLQKEFRTDPHDLPMSNVMGGGSYVSINVYPSWLRESKVNKLNAKKLIEAEMTGSTPGTHQDFVLPGAAALAKELGVEEIRVKHVMAAGRPRNAMDVAKLVAEYFGVNLPFDTAGFSEIADHFAVEAEPVNPHLRNATTAAKNEGRTGPAPRRGGQLESTSARTLINSYIRESRGS